MTRPRTRHRARRRGFTLIEALAAIVIVAVIGGIGSGIIVDSADQYTEAVTRAQLHRELSIAMDRIMRELRAIPLDTAAAGIAPDITWTTGTSVLFNGGYYVAFNDPSDEILLWNGTAPITLLKDVSTATTKFFDESNAEVGPALAGAGCDPIRRIEISITLQRNGVTETLRTRCYVRSTMTGAGS